MRTCVAMLAGWARARPGGVAPYLLELQARAASFTRERTGENSIRSSRRLLAVLLLNDFATARGLTRAELAALLPTIGRDAEAAIDEILTSASQGDWGEDPSDRSPSGGQTWITRQITAYPRARRHDEHRPKRW